MGFLTNLINGISLGSVYAIIALGYTMVYGIAKMLNFAHGDVIMVGGYICFIAMNNLGLPPIVAVLLSIVGCTCLGIVVERAAYKPLRAGIIITGSEIYRGRIMDQFEAVARAKLSRYPGKVLGVRICDDDLEMLMGAARGLLKIGADFLIFSGGMSVDPDDLTPTAIRNLGCDVISHGVPSQPGNMTLMAYLGDVPVMGVPGAAISLPTTIFDVLLPQVYTGLPLTREDLIRLGDGGLCQLCGSCHFPNCTFGRY